MELFYRFFYDISILESLSILGLTSEKDINLRYYSNLKAIIQIFIRKSIILAKKTHSI